MSSQARSLLPKTCKEPTWGSRSSRNSSCKHSDYHLGPHNSSSILRYLWEVNDTRAIPKNMELENLAIIEAPPV